MKDMENAVCVALTARMVVIGTDQHYIRYISASGVQRFIQSVPGPIVTMTGHGRYLMIAYHTAGVYHGNFMYEILSSVI